MALQYGVAILAEPMAQGINVRHFPAQNGEPNQDTGRQKA